MHIPGSDNTITPNMVLRHETNHTLHKTIIRILYPQES